MQPQPSSQQPPVTTTSPPGKTLYDDETPTLNYKWKCVQKPYTLGTQPLSTRVKCIACWIMILIQVLIMQVTAFQRQSTSRRTIIQYDPDLSDDNSSDDFPIFLIAIAEVHFMVWLIIASVCHCCQCWNIYINEDEAHHKRFLKRRIWQILAIFLAYSFTLAIELALYYNKADTLVSVAQFPEELKWIFDSTFIIFLQFVIYLFFGATCMELCVALMNDYSIFQTREAQRAEQIRIVLDFTAV